MKQHHALVHNESIAGVQVECAECGEKIRRRKTSVEKNENSFCSDDCQSQYMQGGKTYIKSTCNTCGEEFEYYENSTSTGKYCSRECLNNRGNKREKSKCEECGDTFEYYPSGPSRGRFCSQECALKDYSRYGPKYREEAQDAMLNYKKTKKKCEVCRSTSELDVHHLEPVHSSPDLADEKENMIVVCYRCHASLDEHVQLPDDMAIPEKIWRERLFESNT